jgi:hypothetical protein
MRKMLGAGRAMRQSGFVYRRRGLRRWLRRGRGLLMLLLRRRRGVMGLRRRGSVLLMSRGW